MKPKPRRVFVTAVLLGACLAGRAWADEGVDLSALESYAEQRDAETKLVDPDGVHRPWRALDAKLARAASKDLTNLSLVITKLAAASAAWNTKLAADSQLRTLLDSALDATEQKLSKQPDDLSVLIGEIKANKSQQAVLRLVIGVHSTPPKRSDATGGRDYFDQGKTARDVDGDEAAQIKLWKKAADRFAAAKRLANSYIRRQRGPVSQTRAAKAGSVYTVIGQGEGGFNGDGDGARRTLLYFVEECRVGPDGLLYILDWNNHRVRRREKSGVITEICGSGVPGDSEGDPAATDLNHPSSLAFEPTPDGKLGKIYIAAWHNHKVKVYDPSGGVDPRYAGNGPRVYTIAGSTQGGGVVGGVDTSGDGQLATYTGAPYPVKYNLLPGIVRVAVTTPFVTAGDLLTADAANETIRKIALSAPQTAANLVGVQVETGTITRFAGTLSQTGIDGDGGDATACTLNFSKSQNAEPDGRMELSPDGTKLYVVCGAGNCVRVMDLMTGKIDRFAGTGATTGNLYSGDNGPATQATLNRPADIAVAPDGTVYISDSYNNVIRAVDPATQIITTYAGAGTSGPAADIASNVDVPRLAATFSHPAGLELDAKGNLYVCDRQNNVIRVIVSERPGVDNSDLQLPVAPYVIPAVSKGGPPTRPSTGATGLIDTYAGTGNLGFNGDHRPARETDFYWPQDVAVDPGNPAAPAHVYVVDWNNHRIRWIRDGDGTIETVVGSGLLGDQGGEGPDAKLNHPTDITFHPVTGDLWIAAWHTDKILRLDTSGGTGHLIYMAGNKRTFSGDGAAASVPTTGFDPMPVIPGPTLPTPAGMAQFNIPTCVKFTQNGDWYVCDEGNQRVRKIDGATDVVGTILGNGQQLYSGDDGPALNATINLPVGQAAQPAGKLCISPDERWLYVCDTNNERVRRIDLTDPNRTITTFAGDGDSGFDGDGGPATSAKLNFPCDVDCDAQGNVYIADRDNSVIRMVVGDGLPGAGTISTFAGVGGTPGYSGDGGAATTARLARPCGIFVVRDGPQAGRMYIADTYNSVVRVVWE
jgi:sugar lactone lactonase YvrE